MFPDPPDGFSYRFIEHIGSGEFSDVYKVTSTKTGENYACKVVYKNREGHIHRRYDFKNEVRIMKYINSPYIVQLYEIYEDNTNYYIIMEYCAGGTLFNMLVKGHGTNNEQAREIFYQILVGLSHIHGMKIAHLDIKPENIFLDECNNVKIGDFGISAYFEENELTNLTCGTKYYVSPECISGNEYNPFISDMWSLGVVLYSMVTGTLPWKRADKEGLLKMIRNGEFTIPLTVIPEIKEVIQGLLEIDPENRWNIEDCLNSRWLYKMDDQNPVAEFRSQFYIFHEESLDNISLAASAKFNTTLQMDTEKTLKIISNKYNVIRKRNFPCIKAPIAVTGRSNVRLQYPRRPLRNHVLCRGLSSLYRSKPY